jgi:transposase
MSRRAGFVLPAIANALEGLARAEAARLAGMSGQALCNAIKCSNVGGLDGLYDRRKPGRPRHLNARQEGELSAIVMAGTDVEMDGISACTREDFALIVRK